MVTDALGRPQTALLLGGSSEIGLAILDALVERGTRSVVLAGRPSTDLDQAAQVRRSPSLTVDTVSFDADLPETHQEVIDRAGHTLGDIDVAVLAFGVLGDQEQDETDPLAAVAVARTNYLGAVSALTVLANRLRSQGHGRIVVLSSVAGERVRRSNYVYGSSKAGLDGFALGLAEALRGTGASLLVVRPGFVQSRMTAGRPPAPMATTPPAVARATLRALDRDVEVLWVPSPLRPVMSILRHLPRAALRRLPV